MASALKAIKKKFKGKRKDEAKNGATLTDTEEQPSLQSAFGKKSEKSQDISQRSGCNSKELPNSSEAGSSHSGGHKPGGTTHKMFHSLDHPGSPDCPSLPPCPRSKSLETSDNKTTLNQEMPPARQHGLPTADQAPSTFAAQNKTNHEYTNGALHTKHQSIPANATDGKPLNSANSEMPADGATAAGISSSSSTQESPVAAVPTAASVAGVTAVSTTTGEPQNSSNSETSVDGSPHSNQASTVASVAARAPAGEPQNPLNNESSAEGGTAAGGASLSSNQGSSAAGSVSGSGSADGDSQNPINSEGGAAAADHSSPSNQVQLAVTNGDSQNPERVAPQNNVNSSSLQQPVNAQATTTVPPNESSLPSLTGLPTQVEPENTAEDTTAGQGTPQEEAVSNNYKQFFVSEKIQGNTFLQDKLAVGLDRTCHRVIKTWEHLACTDEINAPLEVRLRCKINSENSCTLMLFEVLTSEFEDTVTVKDVIDALTRIKRNDAKKIITDVYPNAAESSETFDDFSASLANSQLITKMATLLDQKSRVNQNWRNLGQQFKLSDERLKEIEYGQSTQILMQYLYSKKTDLTIGTFYDEVKKLNRNDVLKKLDSFIFEEGDKDKLMKDVIELDSDAMRSICVCLNNPNRVLKNWRHLAKSSALGIPEDIYKDCEPGKLKSPTEILFEWIFAERNNLTVGQLCSALRKIDRNDLVRDVRKHFE